MRSFFIAAVALCLAWQAHGADLAIFVRDANGAPVRDAVVMAYPRSGAVAAAGKFDWPYRVAQHNIQFDPFVLVVPAGATVTFPNLDTVRHHVYSFSPAKRFELKLYGREAARTITFEKAGVVALGCNIHDQMAAYIRVVDTPFAGKTDASGRVAIAGAPDEGVRVRVWHPYLKAKGGEIEVILAAGVVSQTISVDLRTPPAAMRGPM